MQLGETIATYDVGLALRGESGKFEVTSPAGETYHMTCGRDHSIASLEWSGHKNDPQPFLIRKVAEPVSPRLLKESVEEAFDRAGQLPPRGTPFLLEEQTEDHKATPGNVVSLQNTQDDFENPETGTMDLLYLESDAVHHQPSACVYLRNGDMREDSLNSHRLISSRCTTFNELDAEIRRLQAQLDQIRSRARKKFYLAYAIAAGA